jgi:2-polyprenyl-3-methyl-5-hydroxy-6-metoxy-1,4-benzoquinol methylase
MPHLEVQLRRILGWKKSMIAQIGESISRYKKSLKKSFIKNILGYRPEKTLPNETPCMKPVSPIDGKITEQFLFSLKDTRFGERDLNDIYLDARHNITVTYPPISREKLDELYRKHYSTSSTEIKKPTGSSPYRHYFGGRKVEKLFFNVPIGRIARRLKWVNWEDNTAKEIQKILRTHGIKQDNKIRFLDVGCFEGALLDQLTQKTNWELFGLEPNKIAAKIASEKGHQVWTCHVENAIEEIPRGGLFDVIYLGQSIEHFDDPVFVLRRLRLLLAPGGMIVLSTPNLLSKQIAWFGPTWAHWHPPYHRYIFSKQGLVALAHQVGLSTGSFKTFSHCYWTAMSLAQNEVGLEGVVSHTVRFNLNLSRRAQRVTAWLKLFYDWRGRGDYCYIVMNEGEK